MARCAVRTLIDAGVHDFVYCPGSRNAPLAYALHEAETAGQCKVYVRVDERSAGFLALGLSRAGYVCEGRNRPVGVCVTSGTAVAELYPALLEAAHSGVPLLALTADRPESLWGTGASQTTYQQHIYGDFVLAEYTVSACEPPNLPQLTRRLSRLVDLACARSNPADGVSAPLADGVSAPLADEAAPSPIVPSVHWRAGLAGPVHINLCFDTPLTPVSPSETPGPAAALSPLDHASAAPTVSPASPSNHNLFVESAASFTFSSAELVRLLGDSKHPVLVAGDLADPHLVQHALRLGIPVLAEPTALSVPACLGTAPASASHPQAHPSLVLPALSGQVDLVIVAGHPTLTRPVTQLLMRVEQIVSIDDFFPSTDLSRRAFHVQRAAACAALSCMSELDAEVQEWADSWQEASSKAAPIVQRHVQLAAHPAPGLDPLAIFAKIDSTGANGPVVFLGASNGIRALELVATHQHPGPLYLSNRGLAGIDGTTSTALGVALGSNRAVRVIVGDLTGLHDLTGLLQPAYPDGLEGVNVQVIVLNDGGGQIFRTLEYGREQHSDFYAKYFNTAQQVNFASLADGLKWRYTHIDRLAHLGDLLAAPVEGLSLVEIDTRVDDLRARRAALAADVAQELR